MACSLRVLTLTVWRAENGQRTGKGRVFIELERECQNPVHERLVAPGIPVTQQVLNGISKTTGDMIGDGNTWKKLSQSTSVSGLIDLRMVSRRLAVQAHTRFDIGLGQCFEPKVE